MHRLDGSVIGWAEPKTSRAGDAFAESIEDTARMVENYADLAVIRHPQEGVPGKFAEVADIPVINAGDEKNEWRLKPIVARSLSSRTLKSISIRKILDGFTWASCRDYSSLAAF